MLDGALEGLARFDTFETTHLFSQHLVDKHAFLLVDSSRASWGILGLLLVLLVALRALFVDLGLVWGASWSISC